MEEATGLLVHSLANIWLSYTVQENLPWNGMAHKELSPSTSINDQDILPHTCLLTNLI